MPSSAFRSKQGMSIVSEVATEERSNWPQKTLAIIAIFAVIVIARNFLMPIFLAFLLSLTFSPIRRTLQRRGVPPSVTSAALVLALITVTGLLIVALATPIQNYAQNSQTIAFEVGQKLRGISETLRQVSEASDQVQEMTDAAGGSGEEVEKVVVEDGGLVTKFVFNAPIVVGQLLIFLVLLFFLTASGDMFYEKLVQASPTFADKKRAVGIAYDIERKLSRYFFTIALINACLGVTIGALLWWIGMPNPLLFGVAAFALNFIPYIGAMAGVALTFAIGLVSFDTAGQAAFAAGIYLLCTTLEGQLVTPYAVGRRLKLNPVIVFIAVAFWGWAWSFIGMFIAVPALIGLRVLSEHIPALENLGIFLSGQQTPEEQRVGREQA